MSNPLRKFLEDNKEVLATSEILDFTESTHTSQEAADLLGVTIKEIAKTIVIIIEDKGFLALLPGNKKLRQKALRKAVKENLKIEARDSRLASPDEVISLTGYEIGAVPPIGIKLPIIIDSSVQENSIIYAGGGTTNSVLKIEVKNLFKLSNPIIADIGRNIEI